MKTSLHLMALIFAMSACNEKSYQEEISAIQSSSVKVEHGRVIAWFPKDSLPETRMHEIVDSLDTGIRIGQAFIGGPHAWQVFADKSISYYFDTGDFISNVSEEGDIFIPFHRIKTYQAPWMHETMHALLRTKRGNWNSSSKINTYLWMPIWFTEGLPEYIATKIEATHSIKKFDLMKFGGFAKVDSTCATHLLSEMREDLLSNIGEEGVPTDLFTSNRKNFAPPFYTCSCSFTKYLVERYGLDNMVAAISQFEKEQETIEVATGKEMSELRDEWLIELGIATSD